MATSKLENEKDKCNPSFEKKHSYKETEQPSTKFHIPSFGPTGRINQSEGLPIVMSTFIIALTIFMMEGVQTTPAENQWYLLAVADSTN